MRRTGADGPPREDPSAVTGGILRWLVGPVLGLGLIIFFTGSPVPGFEPEPMPRQISFTLPLEQPRFHWRVLDREALLAGRLTVRIADGQSREVELVVFEDGELVEGWRPMVGERGDGQIHLGFSSSTPVMSGARDAVEVELVVAHDLEGIGPRHTGILRPGRYTARGSYELLTGQRWSQRIGLRKVEPTAILGCWREFWPLEITGEEGWLEPHDRTRPDAPPSRVDRIASRMPQWGTDWGRCDQAERGAVEEL